MGTEPGRMEKPKGVEHSLPWDTPKPDPADGDLFDDVLDLPHDDERLTLARIAAAPILADPPPADPLRYVRPLLDAIADRK